MRQLSIITATVLLTGCAGLADAVDAGALAALAECEEDRSEAHEALEEETRRRMGAEQLADGLREDLDYLQGQLDACRHECRPPEECPPCPPPRHCSACRTCPDCPECPEPGECPEVECPECPEPEECPEVECPPGAPSELDAAMARYERWRRTHPGEGRCSMWAHTGGGCGLTCWRVAVGQGDTAVGKAPSFAAAVNAALDAAVRAGCEE